MVAKYTKEFHRFSVRNNLADETIDDEKNEEEVVHKGDQEEQVDLMMTEGLVETSKRSSQITKKPKEDKMEELNGSSGLQN